MRAPKRSHSLLVLIVGIMSAALVAALVAFSDGGHPTRSVTVMTPITLADSTQAQDAVMAAHAVERRHAIMQAKLREARQEAKQAKQAAETAKTRLQNAQSRIDELSSQVRHLRSQLAIKRAAKKKAAAARAATAAPRHRGWAIPGYIVMCESGGNYRAENSSTTASGAYQILDSTWQAYGGLASGTGHAAYASPGWQDTIAARIWDGGAGASQWVCS